jgi:glycosyltransferase involved in cell wall biosynthesis
MILNITFLAPCKDLSGGIKVIATYANLLMDRGHQVTVVYPRTKQPILRQVKRMLVKTLKNQQDHLDTFRGRLLAVDTFDNQTIPDADVLIATAWETAEWAAALNDRKGDKYYFIQGHEVWNGQKERVYATLKMPFTKITISSWLQTLLSEISGDEDISLISNGCDFVLNEEQALTSNRKYDVGMTYSPIPNKGAELGIGAMLKLAERNPSLKFVIFGSELAQGTLPANVDVFVKPSRKHIGEIFQQTKIWMSTSYEEGFCLPCLEAMSSGAVVVSTDNKGVRDMIEDGQTGYLTSPGEMLELASHANFLLEHPQSWRRMQKASYLRSKAFSWEKSADRFNQLLSNTVSKKAA